MGVLLLGGLLAFGDHGNHDLLKFDILSVQQQHCAGTFFKVDTVAFGNLR